MGVKYIVPFPMLLDGIEATPHALTMDDSIARLEVIWKFPSLDVRDKYLALWKAQS